MTVPNVSLQAGGGSPRCPVCGAERVSFFVRHKAGEQNLYCCHECGLYFVFPHITTVSLKAGKGPVKERHWRNEAAWEAFKDWRREETAIGAAFVEENAECKKMLEVGFGDHPMVTQINKPIQEYWGLEPDERALERSRKLISTDAKLVCAGVERLEEEPFASINNYFDTIIIYNALPALPEPLHALRRLRRLLKDDGRILLSVPDSRCFRFISGLRRLVGMEPYTYFFISYFNKGNLERLFADAGFEIAEWKTASNLTPAATKYLALQYGNRLTSLLIRTLPAFRIADLFGINTYYVVLKAK